MTDDQIRDELHKLSEEFAKLLGSHSSAALVEKTTPENLMVFGLTLDEAEAWLQNEPCFRPSDDWKHVRKSDGEVTVPFFAMFKYALPLFLG